MIETKRAHPNALFLVHPECSEEVTNLADFVGSTSEIIKFATNSEEKEFIIGTENGVMYDNSEELVEIMKDAILDSVKYINMGIAAQQYYYGKATVDHMAQGAISAFDFVLSKRENN